MIKLVSEPVATTFAFKLVNRVEKRAGRSFPSDVIASTKYVAYRSGPFTIVELYYGPNRVATGVTRKSAADSNSDEAGISIALVRALEILEKRTRKNGYSRTASQKEGSNKTF